MSFKDQISCFKNRTLNSQNLMKCVADATICLTNFFLLPFFLIDPILLGVPIGLD